MHLSCDYDPDTGAVIQASIKDRVTTTDLPGETLERWVTKSGGELPTDVLAAFAVLLDSINTFLGRT
jgi:hypothetical protein